MCGRFSDRFTWRELHELYRAFLDPSAPAPTWKPRMNIPPTVQIPVLRSIDGVRRVDLMRWGMVCQKAKDIGSFATHNARDDGFETKWTFKWAWGTGRRCVVPASSFFEFRKPEKTPFAISMANRGPMNFAGLWDEAIIDGKPLLSATILTTTPNSLMEPIHDRMPVVLGDEDVPKWLGEEAASQEDIKALIRSFPAERMAAWEVSRDVNNSRNERPDLADPI